MEYLAHYDKGKNIKQTIKEHLIEVAESSRRQVPDSMDFGCINCEQLREVAYIMGYFHDIGKCSTYFQDYIKNGIDSKLKMHSHISACFVYNLLKKRLSIGNGSMEVSILLFLTYLCVRQHHDCLHVGNQLFPRLDVEGIWKTLNAIKCDLIKNRDRISDEIEGAVSPDELMELLNIDCIKDEAGDCAGMPFLFKSGRIKQSKWYFYLIYAFSLLIDNDKLNTAGIMPSTVRSIKPERVEKYLYKKNKGNSYSDICKKRENARTSMLRVIDGLSSSEIQNTSFFILNGPTGIGKTLSSFECVLKLKKKMEEIHNRSPRIIAAIPFINIIEQNKKEYENVLGKSVKLIVHHRLSDFTKLRKSSESLPIDKALLEVESWDGDVILTTFVQLFQSIFTGNNKSLKKINKLAGSIVILDEAQAIPEDYMPLIGAVLQEIARLYGTKFVLMTATQPKLLEFGSLLLKNHVPKSVQLLPECRMYFANLDRTQFIPMLDEEMSTEGFINLFFEKKDRDKSALIVVNTIMRSIEVFNGIKERFKKNADSTPVYYLSTNIVPKRRREVIKKVKKILDLRGNVVLVSTQTIEAGVDLDFDMAFRDFAPIDSLIQTAGRVNREGKKGKYLPVYIVRLGVDSQYIYDWTNREDTLKLLSSKSEFKENEYFDLTNEYYSHALQRHISEKSIDIWEKGILKLDFQEIEKFRLINEINQVCDVFIELDKKASNLADAYEAVLQNKEDATEYVKKALGERIFNRVRINGGAFERKALLKLVSGKMNDYVIQIRISNLIKNRPLEFADRNGVNSDLFWVPAAQSGDYYNIETGFISQNGNAFVF